MEIHIRRAIKDDIRGIAKVHVDSWKTTYKGIFADEFLENITYEQREKQWENIFQQEDTCQYRFVAETLNGTIVGFIDGELKEAVHIIVMGNYMQSIFTTVSRIENRPKVISSVTIRMCKE